MLKKAASFLSVPKEIREQFNFSCLKKNSISLYIVCIIIFPVEIWNIFRVLFLSNSGLGTANNRIYFGMYCALMSIAAIYLFLNRLLCSRSAKAQLLLQYVTVFSIFLWHILINTYDINRNPPPTAYIFTTAVLSLSVFIRMPDRLSVTYISLGYLLFMAMNGRALDAGSELNITITVLAAIAISISQRHHAVVEIIQRNQITAINRKLTALLEQDQMLGILNKNAIEHRIKNAVSLIDDTNSITLFMLDLDDFKGINDRYGHPCGDYVLTEVSSIMKDLFSGPGQAVGRIGGDEFAALMLLSENPAVLEDIGRRLVERVSAIRWNGTDVGVGCSVGIIKASSSISYEKLYSETDRLLYSVKQRGKGSYALKEIK